MSSNQSQDQRQQQPGQGNNASPGHQRADHAPDIDPKSGQEGDNAAPGQGDSNRTPWQGQQPLGQPPRQQQDDAIGREQQQQGSPSEDTDDTGDTRPNSDQHHASGNN